jgi:hypothetical protein
MINVYVYPRYKIDKLVLKIINFNREMIIKKEFFYAGGSEPLEI